MHHVRWTVEKVTARLQLGEMQVYKKLQPLAPFRFFEGPNPLVGLDVDDSDWPIVQPGSHWGKLRQEFTLRTSFTVPTTWQSPIALYLPLGASKSPDALAFLYGPESLAYLDGETHQGVDPNHQELLLPERFWDGRSHVLALHGWTGIKEERYEMGQPCLVEIDQPTRDFGTTARIALGVVKQLPENDPIRGRLLNALDEAFLLLDLREPLGEAFYRSVLEAHQRLKEGIAGAGSPTDVDVAIVGHAHIDIAWLWPLSQARKKAARSFSTVLRLMEQFPEFCFAQSQPQLYQFIAQDHPEIMRQIKKRVAEGRWEIIGGMWVEADCNITGAESLVRQFLLGRHYYSKHFGQSDSPVLWLPDVFGYAGQLPQLIRQAGLRYFVTAKLSWSQYNRIPHEVFWWQGVDGTQVMTYFITTSKPGWWGATYSANLTPEEMMTTLREFRQTESVPEFMIPFGYGDGGGGPTRDMLEDSRQMINHPGLPRVRTSTVKAFLERLEQESGHRLPTWVGELYLELHRGTYTSQARNKRANRKCETLLHNAEFLAAWASLRGDYHYPHTTLQRAWELMCLNQFHDIIPGSSIQQVYVDSQQDYGEIRQIGEQICETALEALDSRLPKGAEFVVYNPTSFTRSEIVEIKGEWPTGQILTLLGDTAPLLKQGVNRGTLVEVSRVPPYGYAALALRTGSVPPMDSDLFAGPVEGAPADIGSSPTCVMLMESTVLRVEFDGAGDLVRVFDKRQQREVLHPGQKANQLQAFEDRPLDWDAWDIDIFYDEKLWLADPAESMTVIESGPLRACLEIRRRVLNSDIVQRVYLYRDSARIDFDTWIDWQERHVLLKVAFPVAILNPWATYEIQWGNVERPTHRNTSWDWARFESCAHKWVDLSEGNYGVSLLNDCKYGHDIQSNVIRLTLLRGATFPDPTADLGEHQFIYSLLPHTNDWRNGTVPAAYALNNPLIVHQVQGRPQGNAGSGRESLIRVNAQQVIVETVKCAEDQNGLIVRFYEYQRTRGRVELEAGFPVSSAAQCNLLEEDELPLEVAGGKFGLEMHPYQIATVRLIPSTGDRGVGEPSIQAAS